VIIVVLVPPGDENANDVGADDNANGARTEKLTAFDAATCPFTTVILELPGVTISVAATAALSCIELT
jgi:hypothetical protein